MPQNYQISAASRRWVSFKWRFFGANIYYVFIAGLLYFTFRGTFPVFSLILASAVFAYGFWFAWRTSKDYIVVLTRAGDSVHVTWLEWDTSKYASFRSNEISVRLEGSPWSTLRRYVLVVEAAGTRIAQYEGLQWKESDLVKMKEIFTTNPGALA